MSTTMLTPVAAWHMISGMAKVDPIGIRLDPAEKAALEQAAAADDRSISAFARKILADWLKAHEWLKVEASR